MMDNDNKNNVPATTTLNDSCVIYLEESERLIKSETTQNLQLRIEFNDLCYSVCRNSKGKVTTSSYICCESVSRDVSSQIVAMHLFENFAKFLTVSKGITTTIQLNPLQINYKNILLHYVVKNSSD